MTWKCFESYDLKACKVSKVTGMFRNHKHSTITMCCLCLTCSKQPYPLPIRRGVSPIRRVAAGSHASRHVRTHVTFAIQVLFAHSGQSRTVCKRTITRPCFDRTAATRRLLILPAAIQKPVICLLYVARAQVISIHHFLPA